MKFLIIFILIPITVACVTIQRRPQYTSGIRINHPGVTFILPGDFSWTELVGSTYQITLGTKGHNTNETFVISQSAYKLPSFTSNKEFLEFVKKGRSSEPNTGRFELVKNEEELDENRPDTCVIHHTISKDFGAKRGGDYTLIEYFGMNCIHPKNSKVGIFVEISRKAPPDVLNPDIEAFGKSLLKSVEFTDFK